MPGSCISETDPHSAPAALVRCPHRGGQLVVEPAYRSAVSELDFNSVAGAGAHGRAPFTILELPDSTERLHLRPVRHGGWLASAWGDRVAGLRRVERELAITRSLHARGAPVPRPVAAWGKRNGLFWTAFFATVHEEEAVDGITLLESGPTREAVLEAASAAGRAVRTLHDMGCHHADLHIGNLLFRPQGTGRHATVVDLDKARLENRPSESRRMTELMRIYRSLQKRALLETVGAEGCAAFLDSYVDENPGLRDGLMQHWTREKLRIRLHSLFW